MKTHFWFSFEEKFSIICNVPTQLDSNGMKNGEEQIVPYTFIRPYKWVYWSQLYLKLKSLRHVYAKILLIYNLKSNFLKLLVLLFPYNLPDLTIWTLWFFHFFPQQNHRNHFLLCPLPQLLCEPLWIGNPCLWTMLLSTLVTSFLLCQIFLLPSPADSSIA